MFENSNGDISATDHSISSMFDSGGVFADGGSTGAISSWTKFSRYVGENNAR